MSFSGHPSDESLHSTSPYSISSTWSIGTAFSSAAIFMAVWTGGGRSSMGMTVASPLVVVVVGDPSVVVAVEAGVVVVGVAAVVCVAALVGEALEPEPASSSPPHAGSAIV